MTFAMQIHHIDQKWKWLLYERYVATLLTNVCKQIITKILQMYLWCFVIEYLAKEYINHPFKPYFLLKQEVAYWIVFLIHLKG